jgi:hypothetical protein
LASNQALQPTAPRLESPLPVPALVVTLTCKLANIMKEATGIIWRWSRLGIVGLISLVVFAAGIASLHAETRDGNWWVRQSQTVKLAYVLGSIDRTMLTGGIDNDVKHNIIGSPEIGEIVLRLDALYYRADSRSTLVQQMIATALKQIAESPKKR